MAPVIRSRYEQYKRDTQQFTTWLAQTAISLGYPLSKFDLSVDEDRGKTVLSAAAKKNAKRRDAEKAKAKLARGGLEKDEERGPSTTPPDPQDRWSQGPSSKLACDKVDGVERKSPSSEESDLATNTKKNSGLSGRYALRLSLYVEVVQYIVDHGAKIPTEVTQILKRCISLRLKACLRFAASAESESSDKSHRYFIDILITIRGIFERVKSTLDPMDPVFTQNQFDELSSDESEGNAEDIPDIDIPRVASSIPNISFEPEMVIMEAISAIVMFLGDMERVRLYTEALWKDYKSGKVDLVTATVTTNTALDILQRSHDKLMTRVMPVFGNDFRKMIAMTFGRLRGCKIGELDIDMPRFDLVDDQDLELAQIYDFMMVPFVEIFDDLADWLDSGASPACRNGPDGRYDPGAAFDQLSFQARWQQYHILLSEALSSVYFLMGHSMGLAEHKCSLDVDAIIRLMDGFIKDRESSFHLTFAMRIFLDINFILGSDTSRGRHHLHDTASRMIETLRHRPSIEGPIPHKKWKARDDEIVDSFLMSATAMAYLATVPILLIVCHPILCGLLGFRLQIIYQDTGMKLANTFASIQSAAHLYQACRHSNQKHGQCQVEWPDMDLVLELHGTEEIFREKIPNTVSDSLKAVQHVAGFTSQIVNDQRVVFAGLACGCCDKAGLEGVCADGDEADIRDRTKLLTIYKQRLTENFQAAVQDDMCAIEALLRDLKAREARETISNENRKPGRRGYRKEKKHRAAKFHSLNYLLFWKKVFDWKRLLFDSITSRCIFAACSSSAT